MKPPHLRWSTKKEIVFLQDLAKKDINKVRDYFHTIRLRVNWGKINKQKIVKFCVKLI